jgi:hypothetical protein
MRKGIYTGRPGSCDDGAKGQNRIQMRSLIGPMTAVLAVAATLAVFSFKVRADSSGDVETFTVDVAQDSARV